MSSSWSWSSLLCIAGSVATFEIIINFASGREYSRDCTIPCLVSVSNRGTEQDEEFYE